MEIIGKIIQILPEQKGKSAKGEWQKQDFVLETQDQYPKKVCISIWNKKIDINNFENKVVKCFINIESREFNDRWFTNITGWKIELIDKLNKEISKVEKPQEEINDLPWGDEKEPPF